MVKPFEQTLFDMEKGSVSEIVETQFGYHLIKLDDVRSETIEPLENKRYGYEEELKADGVASMFYDLSERLASTAYENPDNLDIAAEELALKIKSSDYFSRNKGEGIAENEKLRNIAFSPLVLEQGSNSDIVEIGPTHAVVLRLNDHIPATAIPLQQVSSKIENILTVQNGYKQTKAAALDVKSKIESTIKAGESLESLKADGIQLDVISSLGRKDITKVSDPSILHNAFEMVAPNQNETPSVKEIDLTSGDVALIVLTAVNAPDNLAQDKLDQVKSGALRDNAIRDFSSVLLAIKESADIDKNTSLIEK